MKKKQQVEPDDRILVRCFMVAQMTTGFSTSFRFLGEQHQSFYIDTESAPTWVPGKDYEMILREPE